MRTSARVRLGRYWLLGVLVAIGLGCSLISVAQGAADPVGNGRLAPTPISVPGYVAPPPGASSAELSKAVDAVARAESRSFYSINTTWTLVCAFLVMFMQAGFALVETGMTRAKNAAHTMSMNFMVYALGITGFFICGFALMCGGAGTGPVGGPANIGGVPTLDTMIRIGQWGIVGAKGFFLSGGAYDGRVIVWFLFMMVFMDTAATIPTGALAERWKFKSFVIFSLFVGGLIYPLFGCWMWGGGWLGQLGLLAGLGHGAVDYAGSSVVHMQGGAMALITAAMLGPRIGKFDSKGRPRAILGHHVPMMMLGTFILAFGWFGFNAGSSLAGTDGRIGIIATNTMLASASGTLASAFYMWWRFGKPDPSVMSNGMLAGLAAITAPCAFVAPWAAFVIGAVAGLLVIQSMFIWERFRIDDPVGAISVHGVNGIWGMLAVALFADGTYGHNWNGVAGPVVGVLYNPALGSRQLLAQLIAIGTGLVWNILAAGVVFWVIGRFWGGNRVRPEIEIAGLDIPEMGAPGYPEFITSVAPEEVPASDMPATHPSGISWAQS